MDVDIFEGCPDGGTINITDAAQKADFKTKAVAAGLPSS
jgi:hypothetical protein